jgi:membrane protease subunit (stomatin/prohibitin family)/Zn-finger nucleic acid-binding protein
VRLSQFFVIEWNEPEPGILAYRYPMLDMEIPCGTKLRVRESEIAVFVDQGRIGDVFGPGLYTLTTANLPLLAELRNWDKGFESPFKSDIYFFSTRLEIDQKWGTSTAITLGDQAFGAIRLRSYGIYTFRIADPRTFFTQISGARESYFVYDLEDRLRNTIVARMTEIFAASGFSYPALTANESDLSAKMLAQIQPTFTALGLELTQFTVQNIALPDELQKSVDPRIGSNMVGDLDKCSQFAVANPGLGAGQALSSTLAFTPATDRAAMASDSQFWCIPQRASLGPRCGEAPMNCSCCGAVMRSENGIFKCDYCHKVMAPDREDDGVLAKDDDGEACPICAIPLMKATLGRLPLLYCTKCDGMLIATQVFQDVIAASRVAHTGGVDAFSADPDDLRGTIACPHCHRPMQAHFYAGPGKVVIDSCETCSLNWLDHGELARIATAPASEFPSDSDLSMGYCSDTTSNFDADHSASYFKPTEDSSTFNTSA